MLHNKMYGTIILQLWVMYVRCHPWSSWSRTKGEMIWPEKLRLGLQGSVIINQPEKKMTENCILLINTRPWLNRGLKKRLGQNCQFLNKYQGSLIEKYGKHRIDWWQQYPLDIPPRRWRTLYYTYLYLHT